jgi:hypothetical protein
MFYAFYYLIIGVSKARATSSRHKVNNKHSDEASVAGMVHANALKSTYFANAQGTACMH